MTENIQTTRSGPLQEALEQLRERLGDRTVAVYRFGTSFGQTAKGPSVRLLLVVDKLDRPLLDTLAPIAKEVRASGIAIRLETKEGLLRGADAFPVFALELKDTAALISGEDVLANVEVEPDRLRLRLEQSFRTIHRDMARTYLEHGGQIGLLATELRKVARRLIYLFQATLIAAKRDLPSDKDPAQVIAAFCEHTGQCENTTTWEELRALAAGERPLEGKALVELYADVLLALSSVVHFVDRMES